jgi:hypothetical protein
MPDTSPSGRHHVRHCRQRCRRTWSGGSGATACAVPACWSALCGPRPTCPSRRRPARPRLPATALVFPLRRFCPSWYARALAPIPSTPVCSQVNHRGWGAGGDGHVAVDAGGAGDAGSGRLGCGTAPHDDDRRVGGDGPERRLCRSVGGSWCTRPGRQGVLMQRCASRAATVHEAGRAAADPRRDPAQADRRGTGAAGGPRDQRPATAGAGRRARHPGARPAISRHRPRGSSGLKRERDDGSGGGAGGHMSCFFTCFFSMLWDAPAVPRYARRGDRLRDRRRSSWRWLLLRSDEPRS